MDTLNKMRNEHYDTTNGLFKGPVSLTGVKYRNGVLNLNLSGNGNHISSFKLDQVVQAKPFVPADLTGAHTIDIVLGDGSNAAN